MAYQVIARKYRPQRFSEVVGQEHVTRTLAQAIEQKRIAHAYLFCGPRGTGKTSIARIFAKCLNATDGPKVNFLEDDPRCIEIAEGRSLDVMEIDAASNRGIEEIRGLRDAVRYSPATSKFKIYVIDEVHMLTKEAFNALLKTLEEPPEHVKFLFATTEPEKVLVTILSRCQRFDLRRIPAVLVVKHLQFIANREKVSIDEAACYAIARGAEGAMRDAESTLDQLISFCGSEIVEADVLSMFGLTAQKQLLALAGAILEGEAETALRQLNDLAQSGKDLGRLLSDLLNHFRNLLIFQISKGDPAMLEVSEAQAVALGEQASGTAPAALTRILEVFGEAEMRLRDAASKKILVEVALLRAIEARNAVSIDSVMQKLVELRSARPETAPNPAANQGSSAPARSSARAATPAEHALNSSSMTSVAPDVIRESPTPAAPAATLDVLWGQLLEAVGKTSLFARAYLDAAHPVSHEGRLFVIGFPSEQKEKLGLADSPRNHILLQTKLGELGHPGAQVKFVVSSAEPAKPVQVEPASSSPGATTPAKPASTAKVAAVQIEQPAQKSGPTRLSKEDFRNDPLIQAALEMFRGQIVEVKV